MRASLSIILSLAISQSLSGAYSWNDQDLVAEIEPPVEIEQVEKVTPKNDVHELRMAKIERMEEIAFQQRDHDLLETCAKLREMEMEIQGRKAE